MYKIKGEFYWPKIYLCLSEEAWNEAFKALVKQKLYNKIPRYTKYPGETTHINCTDGLRLYVTINQGFTFEEAVGILAHETSHVVDAIYAEMVERNPGEEHRAYTYQYILQNFVEIYMEHFQFTISQSTQKTPHSTREAHSIPETAMSAGHSEIPNETNGSQPAT